jgi:hypothetical protein
MTTDRNRVGAQGDCFDDIGAAIKAAIDDDLRPATHRRYHLGQNVEGAADMIELPAAMIGDIDTVDAVIAGDDRVLRGLDAFQDEWQLLPPSSRIDRFETRREMSRSRRP